MDKRHLNALKNKAAKQQRALDQLRAARKEGKVVELLAEGNRFMRDVVTGKHLVAGIERFTLTVDELLQITEAAEKEQEEFEQWMSDRQEMKDLLAYTILHNMRNRS